jgi:hypothetical protein
VGDCGGERLRKNKKTTLKTLKMNSRHAQPTDRSKRSGGQSYSVNNGNCLGRNDFFGRVVETHPQPPFEIHDLITPPTSPVSGRVGMMDRMGKPTPKTRLIDISNGTPTSMSFKSSSSSSTASTSNKKMKSDWENYAPTDLLSPRLSTTGSRTNHYGSTSAGPPVMNVRAPFASTVPPGNRAGHSSTDTSSASLHCGPGNRAGHSYTDTSSASRNRELIDRELIERAVHECVHQPTDVPYLEQLMNSPQWKRDVDYTMSEKSFSEAGPGLGRIDKGALGDKSFRIIRTFVRDQDGTFHDPNLEENAPTVHAFIKILLEVYDLTDVAFQKMLEQGFHCDPHARKPDDGKECHVLLTVNGNHALDPSTRRGKASPKTTRPKKDAARSRLKLGT